MKKIASTENKVNEMFKLAFDQNDLEQKDKAMTNILVLARDSEDGARRIWQDGKGLETMLNMIKNKDVPENLALTAVRVVDELVKNRARVSEKNRIFRKYFLRKTTFFKQKIIFRQKSFLTKYLEAKNIFSRKKILRKNHFFKLIFQF